MAQRRTIWLMSGDYIQRLDTAWQAAQQALKDQAGPGSLLEDDPYLALRAEHEALKREAEAEGTKVVLEAVSRRAWRKLKESHPPRTEGHEDDVKADRLAGVNLDTVSDDLLCVSVIEPTFDSRAAFDEWVNDELSEGEYQYLLTEAWGLAKTANFNPKSLPASPTPKSAEN